MSPLWAGADQRISFVFDSHSYSPATSLNSIAGEWNDKVGDGRQAWSVSRWLLGYQRADYSIQALWRDDTLFRFDNETARFVFMTENHLPLTTGQQYPLSIKADKASSRGVRFGVRHRFAQQQQLGLFISVLRPERLVQGYLQGQAQAIGSNDYDFQFASDLTYDRDPLFDRASDGLSGLGYSLDLSGDFRLDDDWRVNLQWLDIAGGMRIKQAPFTIAHASSDVKQFGADGYLTYDPVVSGRDGVKTWYYHFHPQLYLQLEYRLSAARHVMLEHHSVFNFRYQKLALSQKLGPVGVTVSWIPRMQALGLALAGKHFSIGLESDRLSLRQIKYLGLSGQLYWSF